MKNNRIKLIILAAMIAVSMIVTGCGPKSPEAVQQDGEQPQVTGAPTRALVEATPEPNPADILSVFKAKEIEEDIVNILLLGTDEDSSDGDGYGRNDTTMVLQINRIDNTMKLVSFMRDLEIELNGEMQSLNMANYSGGPARVAKVLDDLFDLKIDYYAKVSFIAFTQIMYVVGNIKIDVQETDIETLKYGTGAVSIDGEVITGINTVLAPGEQKLSAHLTLAYARDRHSAIEDTDTGYTLGGDEARNYRQREVIAQAWERVKVYPVEAVPAGVFASTVYADTDMDGGHIITLVTEMMAAGATIDSIGIPLRTGGGAMYSSYVSDIETGEMIGYTKAKEKYEEAEDRNDFENFEEWRDAHYEPEHILSWNKDRARRDIHEYLVIN